MGRRAAQMWRNQEDLTNLGIVNDKLTIDDQLRVKIALRMMRKAHTKTLRSEADRMRKNMGIVLPGEHVGEAGFASIQDDTVHIRSLDDIMVEAKANFALTKDKRKEEKVSTKFGQLRPIFPSLVEEIRHEQEEKQRLRDEKHEHDIEFVDSELLDGEYHRPSSIQNRRRNQSMQSHNTRNSRATGASAHSQRPHSANNATARGSIHHRVRYSSHEAPGKLERSGEGENRTRNLSKATLASVEALQTMSAQHDNNNHNTMVKHRAELMPIKSSDVHALNNTNSTSKKGRELQQHLHNAHELHFNSGTGKFTPTNNNINSNNNKNNERFKMKRAVSFVPDDTDSVHTHHDTTTHTNTTTNTSINTTTASSTSFGLLKPSTMANINTTSTSNNTMYSNSDARLETRSPSPSSKSRPYSPSSKYTLQSGSSKSLHSASYATSQHASNGEDEFNANMTLSMRNNNAWKDKSGSSRSSFFVGSAVVDDEKINKVQAQRDEIIRSKEDEIRERIRQKELQSLSKAELLLYEQRQRAWMIAVISLSRFKILADALTRKRQHSEVWDESKATKKAIGFIEKWWRRGRVRMMFRRHPHLFIRLKSVVMPFVFRRRLQRKKRSADLIVMFLQDSTGMSETMRAIYAFRQTVIRLQRWIRKWIAVQYCRMRVLWLKCERMYKLKVKLERINQAKEEKSASQHLAHVNYFSNTLHEISHRKKVLNKILEDQELSRQLRQEEVKFQQENNLKKKLEEEERKNARRLKRQQLRMSQKETAMNNTTTTNNNNNSNTNALQQHSIDSASTVLNTTNYLLKRSNTRKENLPWQKKIRNSATNIKIYDHIRDILKYERRRHVLNLVKHKKLSDGGMVGTAELKRYLKNPYSYDGVTELAVKLSEVQVIVQSPAQIYRTPFLLLTQGGIEALERLLRDNRHIKFA